MSKLQCRPKAGLIPAQGASPGFAPPFCSVAGQRPASSPRQRRTAQTASHLPHASLNRSGFGPGVRPHGREKGRALDRACSAPRGCRPLNPGLAPLPGRRTGFFRRPHCPAFWPRFDIGT